jgi:hypothetical protein
LVLAGEALLTVLTGDWRIDDNETRAHGARGRSSLAKFVAARTIHYRLPRRLDQLADSPRSVVRV